MLKLPKLSDIPGIPVTPRLPGAPIGVGYGGIAGPMPGQTITGSPQPINGLGSRIQRAMETLNPPSPAPAPMVGTGMQGGGARQVSPIPNIPAPNPPRGGGFFGRRMKEGGSVKKKASGKTYKSGGSVSSASKRADGCAIKGKTKGKIV